MADEIQTIQPKEDNSGGSALIGALLGGSLGAFGGGLYADVDEEATPSEKLKQRLQTAALVGLLGVAGGAGTGFLAGKAMAPSQREIEIAEEQARNNDPGHEDWGDIGTKLGLLGGGGAALGAYIRGTSGKYPGVPLKTRINQGALRGGGWGLLGAGLVSLAQNKGVL